jgi:hypothetical protein
MAVIEGLSGNLAGVGEQAASPLHVVDHPIKTVLGHYRSYATITTVGALSGNAKMWAFRSAKLGVLCIITRLFVQVCPSGSITPSIPQSELGLFRIGAMTNIYTTNTNTPVPSSKRTNPDTDGPYAEIRSSTSVAAGMTGAAGVSHGNYIGYLTYPGFTLAAATEPTTREMVDDIYGTSPIVLPHDQGLALEHVTSGGSTSHTVRIVVDCSWAECLVV